MDRVVERLELILERLVARRSIHHATVAVERGDGSFRWTGAAGIAHPDGTPMRPETPFFIASVTKLYIATIVLRLVERSEVELEGPIVTYLPSALTSGLHRIDGVDRTAEITVRHLLAHTSGLPDVLEERPRGERHSLVERMVEGEDRAWTLEQMIAIARDLTPHFPPQPRDATRPKTRYTDTNFQLLMAIAEAVTGRTMEELHKDEIWEPLGLRHTSLPGPGVEAATLWAGADPIERPLALRSFLDLVSTTTDTITFLRALVTGIAFEDRATAAILGDRWHRFGFALDRAALRSPRWPIEYGLGMMRFRPPRLVAPVGAVPALIGHTGSTGAWLFHCPAWDLYTSGTVDQATAGAVPFRAVPRMLRAIGPPAGRRAHRVRGVS
jgi:CubicO group peptidase (beta-lactamase class C family)